MGETIQQFVYIKFYRETNNRGEYGDGFYNSIIDHKDSHIHSPLIMYTCAVLRLCLLEWQKKKGLHPKPSKTKKKAERPDLMNYINDKNDSGKIAPCCAATGCNL
jgi:hypothetical protein